MLRAHIAPRVFEIASFFDMGSVLYQTLLNITWGSQCLSSLDFEYPRDTKYVFLKLSILTSD